MNKKAYFTSCFLFFMYLSSGLSAQQQRWQQHVSYTMNVDMDVAKNTFTGTQEIIYTNNSPDTLRRAYYHLYFNAFQPGSMMDERSRAIQDPDRRVKDRIYNLGPDEIGKLNAKSLTQDGKATRFEHDGTILVVELAQPVLPGAKTTLNMEFTGQVPVQIRRSGRDNAEGIRFSMAQWYPKLCEYDYMGWHPTPYVGREFHGVWGDFDVTINLDSKYTVAATGTLQNPNKIGHGYQAEGKKVKIKEGKKLAWRFLAPNVHDFVWAADPDYTHITKQTPDGPLLHFFFQDDADGDVAKDWAQLADYTAQAFQYMNKRFGKYPYPSYSVIQGGDGGMEYPMATLITGDRPLRSLLSVTVHELIHSWYQGALATNESMYPWMDEGFTSYATRIVMNEIYDKEDPRGIHKGAYSSYFGVVRADVQEPMCQHADFYHLNGVYGSNAYNKGSMTLHQLSYVVGQDALDRGMRRFFNEWKFKHPTAWDFQHSMEKASGLVLDWYFDHWVNTTHTIDYGFGDMVMQDNSTLIEMHRIGKMPMPLDIFVTYEDGRKEWYYVPLRMMRGEKAAEDDTPRKVLKDWPWTRPSYSLKIPAGASAIKSIEIDPSRRMADVDRKNNRVFPARKLEEMQAD